MTGIAPAQATETVPSLDDFLVPEEDDTAEIAEVTEDDVTEDASEEEAVEIIEDEEEEEAPEEEEEPEVPAAKMPNSWSKEDAAAWASMTPEQQAVVERREGERDKYLRKVGHEASQTRQQVEAQAREVIAQMHDQHAQALAVYAQQFSAPQPDQRLLYSNNPDDVLTYQRQDAAYRASVDQQQKLHQQIMAAQQQADLARNQTQQAERVSDAQRLQEQLPEWFDPSEGPKLQQSLQTIGAELGYPVELMAEASSTDILALKKAAEWKAKADKLDKLMAKKMEGVRAAKELPRMARPGVKPTRSQQKAGSASRRNEALEHFGQHRSGDAAAALLFERKR